MFSLWYIYFFIFQLIFSIFAGLFLNIFTGFILSSNILEKWDNMSRYSRMPQDTSILSTGYAQVALDKPVGAKRAE